MKKFKLILVGLALITSSNFAFAMKKNPTEQKEMNFEQQQTEKEKKELLLKLEQNFVNQKTDTQNQNKEKEKKELFFKLEQYGLCGPNPINKKTYEQNQNKEKNIIPSHFK